LRKVKTGRLVEQHGDVRPVGQDGADGLSDIRGRQRARGHLVKQRLEEMMVGAVNQRDARIGMTKGFAERQAAKACAEHDDVKLFSGLLHADNLSQIAGNAIASLQEPEKTCLIAAICLV
jgi:hypothetical protein